MIFAFRETLNFFWLFSLKFNFDKFLFLLFQFHKASEMFLRGT